MVYSTRRFVLSLALFYISLYFSVLLALRLPRLGKRELILVLFVCSVCACLVMSVSTSSSCLEWAAACDCGTPWIFSYLFLTTENCSSLCK